MAAYASTVIGGTTGLFEYTIDFPYARPTDVKCFVDGVERAYGSGATDFLFSSSGTKVIFTTPNEPQNGETLEIRRLTDISDAATIWSAGSGFVQTDANLVINQLLYAIDELQVPAFETDGLDLLSVLAAATKITHAHGLSATPTRFELKLINKTTDLGYAAGDVLMNSSLVFPHVVWADATNVYVIQGSSLGHLLYHATTGASSVMTDANWYYQVRAWL